MAVLCAIVEALVRPLIKAWRHFPFSRPIGAELVGHDPFGQPVTFDQAEQQPFYTSFLRALCVDRDLVLKITKDTPRDHDDYNPPAA